MAASMALCRALRLSALRPAALLRAASATLMSPCAIDQRAASTSVSCRSVPIGSLRISGAIDVSTMAPTAWARVAGPPMVDGVEGILSSACRRAFGIGGGRYFMTARVNSAGEPPVFPFRNTSSPIASCLSGPRSEQQRLADGWGGGERAAGHGGLHPGDEGRERLFHLGRCRVDRGRALGLDGLALQDGAAPWARRRAQQAPDCRIAGLPLQPHDGVDRRADRIRDVGGRPARRHRRSGDAILMHVPDPPVRPWPVNAFRDGLPALCWVLRYVEARQF